MNTPQGKTIEEIAHIIYNAENEHEAKKLTATLIEALVNKEVIGEDSKGESIAISCPDFVDGCAVYHARTEMTRRTHDENVRKADQRQALTKITRKDK